MGHAGQPSDTRATVCACAAAGPVSALLQHLRDQEQLSTRPLEQQPGCSAAGARAAPGSTGGALEGAVSLRGSGLSSVPEGVWQVRGACLCVLAHNLIKRVRLSCLLCTLRH